MNEKEVVEETNEINSKEKNKTKNGKKTVLKYVLNISFVLIATGLSIFFSIKDDAVNIWSRIANPNNPNSIWWLAVAGIIALTILIRSFILYCFARLYTRDYTFGAAVALDQIGQFYCAVTPGASGGQIMQAYTYKKQGINISSAVSIMAMYSIVYQAVLIIYGLVSFIVKYDFFMTLPPINTGIVIRGVEIIIPILPLTIFGFILNVSVILGVLLLGYWHGFHNFVMGPIISLLAKLRIVKNPEKSRESLRIHVENFKIEFKRLMTNMRFTILIFVLFVIYFGALFSTPFFVGKALGNESTTATFWNCVFLSNYHQMVTGLVPVPGAAGVSELFFYQMFLNNENPALGFFYVSDPTNALALSDNLCKSALIIWRFATFTLPVFIAGLVTAFYRCSPKDEARASEKGIPNRETFVSLQNMTYVQRKNEVDEAMQTRTLSRKDIFQAMKKTPKPKPKNEEHNPVMGDEPYDNLDIFEEDEDK